MGKLIDLRGRQFGAWSVISQAESRYQPMWLCRCVCGTEREVSGANLRAGLSSNCGCLREHKTSHGHARRGQNSRTYLAWKGMHARCLPNFKQAKDYYDRGIHVCARWSDYAAFLADVGECPPGLTLDRIDNDRGYEPGNCRWTDAPTQRRNCRRVILIHHKGQTMVLKDAALQIGVTASAIHQEYARKGGTHQEAFDRVSARRLA